MSEKSLPGTRSSTARSSAWITRVDVLTVEAQQVESEETGQSAAVASR
jgi:hypothetical protein